jgi:Ser/Thr protein kinase RdoA (MazF antagonist)
MPNHYLDSILKKYNLDSKSCTVEPFGSGLINHTWVVKNGDKIYILQKINNNVFKKPKDIECNIQLIDNYLRIHFPNYLFVSPIENTEGGQMVYEPKIGYFRMFPFVPNSHSKDVVQTPEQAYEAAAQFGKFTRVLADFDATQLRDSISNFHNLSLRYDQFLKATKEGNQQRIEETKKDIETLLSLKDIAVQYEGIVHNPNFKKRVTHHDTKISNVLFDNNDKALCVIDLDTTMAGYFISDVGDMMRTYLSPVSEEEQDFSKIEVRDDFYKAIVKGYSEQMETVLSDDEKGYFLYAGKFMIYMQALRFLTDYLNDDVYYGAKYPKHNLMRARNQIVLLQRLIEKEYV